MSLKTPTPTAPIPRQTLPPRPHQPGVILQFPPITSALLSFLPNHLVSKLASLCSSFNTAAKLELSNRILYLSFDDAGSTKRVVFGLSVTARFHVSKCYQVVSFGYFGGPRTQMLQNALSGGRDVRFVFRRMDLVTRPSLCFVDRIFNSSILPLYAAKARNHPANVICIADDCSRTTLVFLLVTSNNSNNHPLPTFSNTFACNRTFPDICCKLTHDLILPLRLKAREDDKDPYKHVGALDATLEEAIRLALQMAGGSLDIQNKFLRAYAKYVFAAEFAEPQRSMLRKKYMAELWDSSWSCQPLSDNAMTEKAKFVIMRCLGYEGRWGDGLAAAEHLMMYMDKHHD